MPVCLGVRRLRQTGRESSAYESYAPAVSQSVFAVFLYEYLVDACMHTPQASQSHSARGTGARHLKEYSTSSNETRSEERSGLGDWRPGR